MKSIAQKIYGLLFISILLLPAIGLFVGVALYPNCEKRKLTEKPEFEFSKTYFKAYDQYFNDHIGFRNFMNHLNGGIKYFVFNSSTKPQKGIIGKEDFFFYTDKDDRILKSYSNTNLLTATELEDTYKSWLGRYDFLKDKGIEYYMAVHPNKATIYPEFVPAKLAAVKKDTISKIDQLTTYLKTQHAPFELIDSREELLMQKANMPLYYKHDTHWNDLGAYFAYKKLAAEMKLTPYELSDFNLIWEKTNEGGLVKITGLCNSNLLTEQKPVLTLKNDSIYIEHHEADTAKRMSLKKNPSNKSGKRILVFRDSYTSAMVQFISLHFREAYFVWSDYDHGLILKVKPDVVLVSRVERYL